MKSPVLPRVTAATYQPHGALYMHPQLADEETSAAAGTKPANHRASVAAVLHAQFGDLARGQELGQPVVREFMPTVSTTSRAPIVFTRHVRVRWTRPLSQPASCVRVEWCGP